MNAKSTQKYAVMFLRARYLGDSDSGNRNQEERMIARQREECQRIADRLGVKLIREYVEYGGTGSIGKRPELRLMLDELRSLRDVAYVITERVDRIARRADDWQTVRFELAASGTQLVTEGGIYANK